MKKSLKLLTLFFGTFFILESTFAKPQQNQKTQEKNLTVINIFPSQTYPINNGIWEGWGTSFCWWANRLGYSDELATQCAKLFYSKDGLDLNIARFNIGGGDNPKHNHITRTDSIMPGYLIKTGKKNFEYDWTQDKNQRNALKKAIEYSEKPLIIEAFSNSAPYFMTKSGCSSGAIIGTMDNLKKKSYKDFANYIATVIEHYKNNENINFESVSPMNEPTNIYWWAKSFKQEGCHFGFGKSQSRMIEELHKALEQHNLSEVKIAGTDETSIDAQTKAIKKLSKKALSYLDRIDTHTYLGDEKSRKKLSTLVQEIKKPLWMSEVDGGNCINQETGEMACPLWFADRIITDIKNLKCSAWVIWQIIDSHESKDGYMGRKDYGIPDLNYGYWGCAFANHDTQEILLSQKYYVFGQFTRYIKPGMKLIETSGQVLAAYDEQKKQLVIVAINPHRYKKNIQFNLSQFKSTGKSCTPIRTSGTLEDGEQWKTLSNIEIIDSKIDVTMPALSITTFILDAEQ